LNCQKMKTKTCANWATFGLGSQIEVNTKEIRDALFKRLGEEDDEIRGEALVGLSIRKDKRVLGPLLKELTSKTLGHVVFRFKKRMDIIRLRINFQLPD
jgi:hypothetical protein